MRRVLFILALIIVFSSFVYADNVEVEVTPVTPDVFPGEKAEFTLTVTNLGNDDIAINVKAIDLNWELEQDLEKYTVKRRRARDITLVYEPLGELPAKKYGANLVVWNNDFRVEKILPVSVVDYEGLVDVNFISVPSIDPRKGTLIKLELDNKYKIDLDDLKVSLVSESFDESETVDLMAKESVELEFPVSLHPQSLEGSYPVRVKIDWDDNVAYDNFFDLNIETVRNVKELVNFEEGLLFDAVNIERFNEGNTVDTDDFVVEFSLFEKVFTSFDPEPTSVDKVDGRYEVVWSQNLSPGDTALIRYETNYRRPLFIVLVLIILVVVGYYLLRRSLKVKKKVVVVKRGDTTLLRVTLSLNNKGAQRIKLLTLIERIPNAVKAPNFGTVKPSKVSKAGNGTSVIWNIKSIGKGEERVYSYTVPIKLHKEGIVLPPAYVRYSEKGKRVMNTSNTVTLGR